MYHSTIFLKNSGDFMKTTKRLFLSVALSAMSFITVSAQESPEGQFGIGVTTGSSLNALHGVYAITPAIHVGSQFGISSTAISTEGSSQDVTSTGVTFAPYVKGLFFGLPAFKPFVEVQYAYTNINTTTGGTTTSQPISSLWGAIGAEFFVNRYIGIYGKVRVASVDLDFVDEGNGDKTKFTSFGLLDTGLGIEWFF
jgi:hypothetical protein